MTLHAARAVLQSFDAEVIVVDDASTDGTAERFAREEPRVRIIRRETNGGFARAANDGVRAATGDLILLLNSDAIVAPDTLSTLARAFHDDPLLGVASAQLFDEDGTPQWTGGQTPTLPWMIGAVSGKGHWLRALRRRRATTHREPDWVSGAAMMFRREVWEPLEERYRFYCQDIDFCLRARARGWRIAVVPEAHVTHARGATAGRDRRVLRDDLLEFGRVHYGRAWWWFARVVLSLIPVR
ncbi:MAG TPA: glycosyltransferase family 2 protein [Thermoanaerobaculia bacterium]|nr:glycosyltransferase family 2 protein [Thermoanaerobaculia bacterium]